MNDTTLNQTLRLLDWYAAMGVDAVVGPHTIDWSMHGAARPGAGFVMPRRAGSAAATATAVPSANTLPPARTATLLPAPSVRERRPSPATPVAAPTRAFSATPPDAAVLAARAQAPKAASIEALGQMLSNFDGCGLKATAKSLCFYRGASQARLMVIGEAPAREDDLAGEPFVGPVGDLLDRMLAAIGLTAGVCHITNVVYWRPPGNRMPTPQETEVCRPFLERQVALVAPDVVLLLGAAAARQVLGGDDSIMRLRGKWRDIEIGGHATRVMASLHPSYLLRTPSAKQQVWRDLLAVKSALAQ